MYKYELMNIRASNGATDSFQLKDLENPEQPLEWFPFIKVKEMLIMEVQIKRMVFTRKGVIIDITTTEEIERVFKYLKELATTKLSEFAVGALEAIRDNAFNLHTNIIYGGLQVTLQFELGTIRKSDNSFDKPPIKIKVKFLSGKREIKELFICEVFDKEESERHTIGQYEYRLTDIYGFIQLLGYMLSKLKYITTDSILPNIFSRAFYKLNACTYTGSVARLLCARLIDKYNIFAYNPYQLFELQEVRKNSCCSAVYKAFYTESEIQDFYIRLSKYGERFMGGFGIQLPLDLSNKGNDAHSIASIAIRLIATEKGICIQLIKVVSRCRIDLLPCIFDLSAVYSHTLIKSFFIPMNSLGRASVLRVINDTIEYINLIKNSGELHV